jgi:hypothetical protein
MPTPSISLHPHPISSTTPPSPPTSRLAISPVLHRSRTYTQPALQFSHGPLLTLLPPSLTCTALRCACACRPYQTPQDQHCTLASRPRIYTNTSCLLSGLSHRRRSLPVTCEHSACCRASNCCLACAARRPRNPHLRYFVRRSAAQHPGCHTNIARAVVDTPCKGPPLLSYSAICCSDPVSQLPLPAT